jgi:NAD(P)-dependent dehydrogenase (short-subunit alcohol dehydrogenase family)
MSSVRTAVVTGASAGIGAAIAAALGALGWKVAIGARRTEALADVAKAVETAGGHALAHALDVTDPESIERFFAATEKVLGPVDVVVNNAGIGLPGLLHELPIENVERELATNLLGPIRVARRALPSMLAARRGDLVFISSMNVVEPRPFQLGYTAAKAGLEGMVSVLRRDLEGTGIRTTIVRPGATRSEFGFGWDPNILMRVIDSWKEWGYMRHLDMMEGAHVAHAVVSVVTAPPGLHVDVVQVNPEKKPGS